MWGGEQQLKILNINWDMNGLFAGENWAHARTAPVWICPHVWLDSSVLPWAVS